MFERNETLFYGRDPNPIIGDNVFLGDAGALDNACDLFVPNDISRHNGVAPDDWQFNLSDINQQDMPPIEPIVVRMVDSIDPIDQQVFDFPLNYTPAQPVLRLKTKAMRQRGQRGRPRSTDSPEVQITKRLNRNKISAKKSRLKRKSKQELENEELNASEILHKKLEKLTLCLTEDIRQLKSQLIPYLKPKASKATKKALLDNKELMWHLNQHLFESLR